MSVAGSREAEMAQVFSRIACLLHGAEKHAVDQLLFRLSLRFAQQPLEFTRGDIIIIYLYLITESQNKFIEIFELGQVRSFVDTIERRNIMGGDMKGHRLVSRQHEFFDDPVGN